MKKVLVIGGGFAGLACVKGLANKDEVSVTLVDKTNHHVFQPLLYQVATATLAATDISRSLRGVFAKAENVSVFMDEIETVNVEGKYAVGKSGRQYPYDSLVMAAGARTGYFGNDHWSEHTIGLKSLNDAYRIRQTVLNNLEQAELTDDAEERKRLMTIAITGGGPTGVELAGAFIELIQDSMKRNFSNLDVNELRVVLVEAASRLLPPFAESNSAYALKRLEELGVEIKLNTFVTDVQPGKLIMGEETLEAGAILWGAGVQGVDVIGQLPVERHRNGKVTPEADLSLKGHKNIFVAGDVTHMKDINDQVVPGVAPAATQMGKFIAKTILSEAKGKSDENHREGYAYFDKGSMAIIGKLHAVMQFGDIKTGGVIAWLAWLFVHVLVMVDFRPKLAVLSAWAWQYLGNKPGSNVFTPASQCDKEDGI